MKTKDKLGRSIFKWYIFPISILSIFIICIFSFLFLEKDSKQLKNAKERILCETDSSVFYNIYSFHHDEMFAYEFYLWKKLHVNVSYYLYRDIMKAYNLSSPDLVLDSYPEVNRVRLNIIKKLDEIDSFEEAFIDSCVNLSKSGLFQSNVNSKMDSIVWGIFEESVKNDDSGFIQCDLWCMYLLGYINYPVDTKQAKEWYLKEVFNEITKKESVKSEPTFLTTEQSDEYNYPEIRENSIISNFLLERIRDGGILSYEMMKARRRLHHTEYEMLLSALIMANKYHYKNAYWDVYKYLWQIFNCGKLDDLADMSEFDDSTKKLAIYHLRLAAKLNLKEAISIYRKTIERKKSVQLRQ